MKKPLYLIALGLLVIAVFASWAVSSEADSAASAAEGQEKDKNKKPEGGEMTIYDFTVKDGDEKMADLSQYKGKVLLIVNTATQCGLTPQYEKLQALYEKYKDKGFEVLDFPSNQFLQQAPGTDKEISDFCTLNYGTTFPRFAKMDVNGQDANPLFVWLKKQAPKDIENKASKAFEEKIKEYNKLLEEGDIKWNFTKFLIDKNGNVADRYSPVYKPEDLEKDIEKLLAK